MGVSDRQHKPRELRRRAVLPARMRTAAGWSDACILNVSSRGLLVHSARLPDTGCTVQIRRLDCAINARVIWRTGAKAGLQADDRIKVDEILSLSETASLAPSVPQGCSRDRRKRARSHEGNRFRARAIEFASIAVIAASLSGGVLLMVQETLGRPLAYVETVLSASR